MDGNQQPNALSCYRAAEHQRRLRSTVARVDNHHMRSIIMPELKSILIWGGDDILSSFVESLVSSHPNWQVVYISKAEGRNALWTAVERSQPDILIILQAALDDSPGFAFQALEDNPAVKVILLNLENNMMNVYCKRKILAGQAADLIKAIESEQ